jgi:YfiH family protein
MTPCLILEKHDGFYAVPIFEKFGARAVFTARKYDMSFQDSISARSRSLRSHAYQRIGIAGSDLICPSQVHADRVRAVTRKEKGRGAYSRATAMARTDALMTAQRGLPLAILTADCLPVFIMDPEKKAIAVVHAGWKGVARKIIAKTVRMMRKKFSCEPADLLAALGPSIRPCCYEVAKEFLAPFAGHVLSRDEKLYFDLAGAAEAQLKNEGVPENHIYDSRICTSCQNDEFFSYRREGAGAGRSMSVFELMK